MTSPQRALRRTRLFFLELLSIIIGVSIAFWLNQWKENQKLNETELKSLAEIRAGLYSDLVDIEQNISGHQLGIMAVQVFRDYALDKAPVPPDSLLIYHHFLFRDFVSIQNTSPYEALKARGLGIVANDSLRLKIINIYDFQFEIIEDLEENYAEMQFFQNYAPSANRILLPYLQFNEEGLPSRLEFPARLSSDQQKELLLALMKVENNRRYLITYYQQLQEEILRLITSLNYELKNRNYESASEVPNR